MASDPRTTFGGHLLLGHDGLAPLARVIDGALLGDFACTFNAQTTEFNVSGNPQLTFTVTRNGGAIFSTSTTRTQSVPNDAGLHVIEVTTDAQVVNQPVPGGSASRTYSCTATLIPRPLPSPQPVPVPRAVMPGAAPPSVTMHG